MAVNECLEPMKTSRLLTVPFEVRQVILRDLLEDPLSSDRLPLFPVVYTHQLHPAILATCRQLHDEGTQILYSHTLHFEIWHSGTGLLGFQRCAYSYRSIYTGRQFRTSTIPDAIRSRVSKVNVQLNARRVDGWYWFEPIQGQVRAAATLIDKNTNWQHLTIRAYTSAGTSLHESVAAGVTLSESAKSKPDLQPFLPLKRIRGRTSLVCDGVDPRFAVELADIVTSSVPSDALDLDGLYVEMEALKMALDPAPRPQGGRQTETDFAGIRYAQGVVGLGALLHMARRWRDYCAVSQFLAARRKFLEKVKEFLDELDAEGNELPATGGDVDWVKQELRRLLEQDIQPPA